MTELAPVEMPKFGLTMTSGTVVAWLVDEGDEIAAEDEIVEVDTEKTVIPLEAPSAGVLRRRVAKEGASVPVGGLLGVISVGEASDAEVDAFISQYAETSQPEEPLASRPRVEDLDLGVGRIRLVSSGTGDKTTLLIHGFGGDSSNWQYLLPDQAEGRQWLALDLPGHGASTKHVGDGDIDHFVSAVRELLDHLGVTGCDVVGHSLGAQVAIALAAREPSRVTSVALIAPAGFAAPAEEFVDGFVAASSRRELKEVLGYLYADPSMVSRGLVDDVLKYLRVEGVSEALGRIRDRTLSQLTSAGMLGQLRPGLPMLVIWGSADRVIDTRPHLDRASAAETLAGVGHSPHAEAPEEVRRLLAEFYQAHGL